LGAQTNYDKKTGTSIVNGAHDAKKLSEVLEIFIKKYVQCYSCGNPETVIKIRKECIFLKCKACGHTSDVDMRDKLTGFIVKNPPENKVSKAEAKVRKDEKERMKAAEKAAEKEIKAIAKEKKKKERRCFVLQMFHAFAKYELLCVNMAGSIIDSLNTKFPSQFEQDTGF
jgi:translation initiation factor 5